LALDPDAAGIQATFRGLEVAREALDSEWQPVFNPRGLVGFEAKLGAEIRVLRLPPGCDPDDVIREDHDRWARLVEQALPVVDFYLAVLLEGLDLGDTKAKARVVDTLVPVLRAVADPVEQADYVQKVARAVRVDRSAVAARVRAVQRSRAGRRRRVTGQASDVTAREASADLEGHCLALLLQRPNLLDRVDQMLIERELTVLRGADFGKPSHRTVFEAYSAILTSGSIAPVEELRRELPLAVTAEIRSPVEQDYSLVSDEQLARDVVRTILRMRLARLRREWAELRTLLVESQEAGDVRGAQYDEAQLSFSRELLVTQKAMARLGIG
jgi:DNA primase